MIEGKKGAAGTMGDLKNIVIALLALGIFAFLYTTFFSTADAQVNEQCLTGTCLEQRCVPDNAQSTGKACGPEGENGVCVESLGELDVSDECRITETPAGRDRVDADADDSTDTSSGDEEQGSDGSEDDETNSEGEVGAPQDAAVEIRLNQNIYTEQTLDQAIDTGDTIELPSDTDHTIHVWSQGLPEATCDIRFLTEGGKNASFADTPDSPVACGNPDGDRTRDDDDTTYQLSLPSGNPGTYTLLVIVKDAEGSTEASSRNTVILE